MKNEKGEIVVSAPARICLFGEHQDYLGLPVIAAAIDLRARLAATRSDSGVFNINMPGVGVADTIDPRSEAPCEKERDYLRSAVNVMLREGYEFDNGYDITLTSSIPAGKGCGSSSAIVVAWIMMLSKIATKGKALEAQDVAQLAYRAEVVAFDEPGGMMDHFASALGGTIFIKTQDNYAAVQLPSALDGCFILGDSHEGKNTTKVLAAVRELATGGLDHIRRKIPDANWHTIAGEAAKQSVADAPEACRKAVAANLANRDITREATRMFEGMNVEPAAVGMLITEQHEYLSKYLEVSTPKIDSMVLAALEGGAYGAKVNGSGGGGCMFAYAPADKKEAVALSIESAGGTPIHINICEGVREEPA